MQVVVSGLEHRVHLQTMGLAALLPARTGGTNDGRWNDMLGCIPDDLLDTIAIRGEPAAIAARIRERYADKVDRIALASAYALDQESIAAIVSALKADARA